jgi:hypothetical protein
MPVLGRGPVIHHSVHERLDAHVAVGAAQAGHQAAGGRVAGNAAEGRPQRLCRHVGEAVGGNDRVRQLRVEVACRFHQRFPGLGETLELFVKSNFVKAYSVEFFLKVNLVNAYL